MPDVERLPEPLRGRDPGTWQYETVTTRLPAIAERVIAENELTESQTAALQDLITSMPYGPIRPLDDPLAFDAGDWERYVAAHAGESWLNAPWFFVEMVFFRRILEATGYFGPGPGLAVDPYGLQKGQATTAAVSQWSVAATDDRSDTLRAGLLQSLWGNQADLSIWPMDEGSAAGPGASHLLVDDSADVRSILPGDSPVAQVDMVLDNAGHELVSDLGLVDLLLTSRRTEVVRLHMKPYPTFVSDVTFVDLAQTVNRLIAADRREPAELGRRLAIYLSDGRIRLRSHPFWVSPLPWWEMPGELATSLQAADLVITKGDMNYRRLHGDLHWPFTTPFATILRPWPRPLLALRVCKSEVASGLDEERIADARRSDPDWAVSGRWGMVQLYR